MKTRMAYPCYSAGTYEGDLLLDKELMEFYERAREATREALKECNAKLAAALQSSPARVYSSSSESSVKISALALTFSDAEIEKEYCWVLGSKRDSVAFSAEFIIRMLIWCCLLFLQQAKDNAVQEDSLLCLYLPHLSLRFTSHLWNLGVCALMIFIHFRHQNWYIRYRNIILFVAYSSVFLVEGLTIPSSHLETSLLNFSLILGQSALISMLHRITFCSHMQMRMVWFALQIVGIFLRRVGQRTIFYVSASHGFGVVLAYLVDQQSRIGFLRSLHRTKQNTDSIYCLGVPRRALGGFAGGFAGVSSLKCTSSLQLQPN